MSFGLHRAMNVAPDASASLTGFSGSLNSPSGSTFDLNPCWEVGVGCPVVNENALLSWTIIVIFALYLNVWMKCAIPSAYAPPSPMKEIAVRFGFPSFNPSAVGIERPWSP